MDDSRSERRAETARQNDDSDILKAAAEDSPGSQGQQGREGGNLQTDLGTQAEEDRANDPQAHESVTKGDHIAHGHGESPPHPAEKVVSERD